MGVEVRKNFDFKKMGMDRLQVLERAMGRLLEYEAKEIIKRTQSGKDANLKAFAPYTSAYAKYKYTGQKGGNSNNRGGFKRGDDRSSIKGSYSNFGRVDLTFSGQLLQAIRSRVKRVGRAVEGVIYFLAGRQDRSNRKATNFDVARGLLKKREFFGLDPIQKKRIKETLQKA